MVHLLLRGLSGRHHRAHAPIAMFDGRRRPKGLEFPTCRECNNSTRLSDTAASLLARAYPDAQQPDDLKRLLRGVRKNIPGLLEEMYVDGTGHRDVASAPAGAGVLRVNGPIVKKHIDVFGAKLGLALHFEAHGSPLPPMGGVQAMFFTNAKRLKGRASERTNPVTASAAHIGARQAGSWRPVQIFLGAHRGEEA